MPHLHCENGVCRMVEDDEDFPIQDLIDFLNALPAEVYPIRRRTFLLEALDFSQRKYGQIPPRALLKIANVLRIPLHEVAAVVRFYNNRFSGTGFLIRLCCGDHCFEHNGGDLSIRLQDILEQFHIGEEFTLQNGISYFIEMVDCLGACALAPVVQINGVIYTNPSEDALRIILKI